ncbi:hypothetical protein ITI46_33545 [Streptomyces oryzae]|uniref:DUF3592 domain-containing protein n=1 Tax=Streptomyces oryzae TaxID=1434886 RepID=A0ABS3XM98_9ACTN|nr:hypothetical protein [Streptomyces oryzae]MBO8196519.1 hypothetical protein [Streptomyces oryzae]
MSGGSRRAVRVWCWVCALGVLAALDRVIAAPSTPPPRWDLVSCLGAAAVGAVGGRWAVRNRPGQGATAYWWPGRRAGLMGFGLAAWLLVVISLVMAPLSFDPDAWRMREAGYTIRALPVERVLSTETHSGRTTFFVSDVRLTVPFDSGKVTTTVSLRTERRPSEYRSLRAWALYVPSAEELGWITSNDRSELEAKVGGPADPVPVTFVALGIGISLLFAAIWGRAAAGGLAGLSRRGQGRSYPVTVVSAGVASGERHHEGKPLEQTAPRLVLLTPDGGEEGSAEGSSAAGGSGGGARLEFFLDLALDPAVLAPLVGLRGRVCRQERTDRSVGRDPGSARAVDAVLVLDDGRFARGKLQTASGEPLPAGAPMPPLTPDAARAQAQRALPTPPWDPLLHPRSLSAYLFSLLALGATAYGLDSPWAQIAGASAVLAPALTWLSVTVGRHLRLTELAEAGEDALAESGEAAPAKEPAAAGPLSVPPGGGPGSAARGAELSRALWRMCVWAALTAAALGTAWILRDGDHQSVSLLALAVGFVLLRPLYVSARALRALRPPEEE